MIRVLLIYPFFKSAHDRSLFRFPPLGIGYVAAALRRAGRGVSLLDCTFLSPGEALRRARAARADVVGIYAMITMREAAAWFARELGGAEAGPTEARRAFGSRPFLVAGGPLPTSDPGLFLDDFDAVVQGEGERTMPELVTALASGKDVAEVPGVVRRSGASLCGASSSAAIPCVVSSATASSVAASAIPRPREPDLDSLPFPARDLLPNRTYIRHGRRRFGYAITTVMTTRGCPFSCEFCSNVLFGKTCRAHSPGRVVDEVETALSLGYDRIHFADDVFTLDRSRVAAIGEEISRRRLRVPWECLGRVDTVDSALARRMKEAGCDRIFFGIESGNDRVLSLMNKGITTARAARAVDATHAAGLHTGAFFILYYPGETDETVLTTLRFALSLPLDYLSFTMPYPIPGTGLYRRVMGRSLRPWKQSAGLLFDHALTYDAEVSQAKMRFAILKGQAQFELKRRLGSAGPAAGRLFGMVTDVFLRGLR